MIFKFQDIVSKGPVYICTCCDQLWYKHSVSSTVSIRASNPSITKYLLNTRSEGNVEWLCNTCYNYLKKDIVPPCAAVNGMQFPPKPSFFDLNELECGLLAPRLAFQKLMEAPRGQQLKIHGNIVNVPADVANTVSSLPRLPNETGTIKVKLKRNLLYKSAALSLNIRPAKEEYRNMVQMLNKEQKEFFYHILHLMKTSDNPFYNFLSGGAGMGKSHLTKALYQAALKFYNAREGEDFHHINVLVLAPTGKAAYNIKGNTIHSSLAIPANQSLRNYKHLDSSRLNTLRSRIGGVKLIFLDEISVVGNCMFNIQINNRLKDIKGTKQDFGGVSIIAIGDLFQLSWMAMFLRIWTAWNIQCLHLICGKNISQCLSFKK